MTRRPTEGSEPMIASNAGGSGSRERSDVVRNRAVILEAAGALFDRATEATAVTMDDVAAAAGVGKGTVFRRFGDQAGLLRSVFDARIAALVEQIEFGPVPLGPSTPPRERIPAALVATVQFKVENRQLTRLLERVEQRPTGASFFETPNYRWAHALLSQGLAEIGDPAHAQILRARVALSRGSISSSTSSSPRVTPLPSCNVTSSTTSIGSLGLQHPPPSGSRQRAARDPKA